jgi:hypothetical protein
MKRLLLVALMVMACGGNVAAQDIPPAGGIWFGKSFDPTTFVLTGKHSSVGTQEPSAFVAHLTKSIEGTVTVRASLDGTFVGATDVPLTGSGQVMGLTLGALVTPGQWTYDVVDVGGNVLASGTVTAQ